MNRKLFVYIISFVILVICGGCGEETAVIPEEIEQVVIDEVSDYSKLGISELEVLGFEGDVEAQYQLGLIYEYGSEIQQQNFSESMRWYEIAEVNESADAVCALGYFYLNGVNVEKNVELAINKFDKAIELGSVNANVGKARCLMETIEGVESDEESVESEIFELIRLACARNDADGTYYMGYLYEHGIGCELNIDTAFKYYKVTSELEVKDVRDLFGINSADVELGLMYLKGIGGDVNTEKAIEYLTKAYDRGYAPAAYYLGQIYENGFGLDQDYGKALEYYLVAGEDEFAPALNQIGYLYYNGFGVDTDFASAVYYQKLAALQGYAPAQVNLGYLYENGYGVERNLQTAMAYYELAAEAGYEGAAEAVVRVQAQINDEA